MSWNSCSHIRIKKNYNFGRKSVPLMKCKDCGKVLKQKDITKPKQKQIRKDEKRKK